jgi:hypothetical protein
MPRDPDPQALCDELWLLVERGPGENPGALRRAKDVLQALEAASDDEKWRERLRLMSFHFEEWIHDARWRQYGPAGERLRTDLYSEIASMRGELARPTT